MLTSEVAMSGPRSAIDDYVEGIKSVLPEDCLPEEWPGLRLHTAAKARPGRGESLLTWIKNADRNSDGKLPLALVLGETQSAHRRSRQPRPARHRPGAVGNRLTMACTSDGAAGARAALGLLRASRLKLADVDFDARIDEWPSLCKRLPQSHLIVIGTPEVNICATFLHALVQDFHFGNSLWPPELESMGDRLVVDGLPYLRVPRDNVVRYCGGIFLLRNPWNRKYRLLWIAGLSGRATWWGCSLVASNWNGYKAEAKESVGVVFGNETEGGEREVVPLDWLVSGGSRGRSAWRSSLRIPPSKAPAKTKRRPKVDRARLSGDGDRVAVQKHVVLAYCHANKRRVKGLRDDLIAAKVPVWWDGDIRPGQDWEDAVRKAIVESCAVVLCFSKQSQARKKSVLHRETSYAIRANRDRPPGSGFLVPVRLSDCRIPAHRIDSVKRLSRLEYIDLFPASKREARLQKLIGALRSASGDR